MDPSQRYSQASVSHPVTSRRRFYLESMNRFSQHARLAYMGLSNGCAD